MTQTPRASTPDTKTRVIQAATRLFATRGLENVLVRDLTQEAGVNLASVNYHFGSKESLYEAVLSSISESVNRVRLKALECVLRSAARAKVAPALADILETFVAPYLEGEGQGDGAVLVQLLLKDRLSRNEMTARLIQTHFDPVARAYVKAIAMACPALDERDLYWRYTLMYGAIILTISDYNNRSNRLSSMSEGLVDGNDLHPLKKAMIDFLVAGFGAPSSRL